MDTSKIRYSMLGFIGMAMLVNFIDRATLSVAAPLMSKELGFDAATMGWAFSAFGWAYMLFQIPGGILLDKFGSRLVYGSAILIWSIFTFIQGLVYLFPAPFIMLFLFRFLMGAAEAPATPASSRLTVQWFPDKERGFATSIYQTMPYVALGVFTPVMTWFMHTFSWHYAFYTSGILGMVFGIIWLTSVRDPLKHKKVNQAEINYIQQGGGIPNLGADQKQKTKLSWLQVRKMCCNRMMIGIYIGQFSLTSITWFFFTWFPTYLYEAKGMSIIKVGLVAAIPALAGFLGGIVGGLISDYFLRKGYSLTFARKFPIILGMLLSCSIIAANYTRSDVIVVLVMSIAFFAKGFGNLGWCILSDTSPKEALGLSGGIFNTFGNVAGILTPLVIGFILEATKSFDMAILYVGSMGIIGALSYLFIVGPLQRQALPDNDDAPRRAVQHRSA
ncbi:MFS transporter [Enterobacter hormaechei]|uniref:MFS transporter n=1 Tax=Enterobacter ludwigii TaxID=299767 RepID=A0AAX3LI90_9ENTR|nr:MULTISPECIES: MFS transporter [Enterobacteriaceae]MCW4755623.1 MFS transporter [Enterobacter hormaechei]MDV0977407.1 MFS transporter [Klebsiella pneumoniae]WCE15972.1 MFS transporter [Enterobacter ludwigii]